MAQGGDDSSDKTLDPTQKKLDDAIKRGDVPKSQELNTWMLLSAGTLGLFLFGTDAVSSIMQVLAAYMGKVGTLAADGDSLLRISTSLAISVVAAIALPVMLLVVAAIASNLLQHRVVFSAEAITPKFQKVSPLAGFKRVFGKEALVNFTKGLIKIIVIASVIAATTWPEREKIALTLTQDVTTIAPYVLELVLKLLAASLAVMVVIVAADFIYQRITWYERQKMSFQEMKEEFKQSEGNPEIKAKIRSLRRQKSQRRMMAEVPKATVVITNPTHYAVALRYEPGMPAPICVAKGVDAMAFRIREVAQEHDVTIVENPPLARALHATIDIEDEIPAEHFRAVAEVISYVMKLKRGLVRR